MDDTLSIKQESTHDQLNDCSSCAALDMPHGDLAAAYDCVRGFNIGSASHDLTASLHQDVSYLIFTADSLSPLGQGYSTPEPSGFTPLHSHRQKWPNTHVQNLLQARYTIPTLNAFSYSQLLCAQIPYLDPHQQVTNSTSMHHDTSASVGANNPPQNLQHYNQRKFVLSRPPISSYEDLMGFEYSSYPVGPVHPDTPSPYLGGADFGDWRFEKDPLAMKSNNLNTTIPNIDHILARNLHNEKNGLVMQQPLEQCITGLPHTQADLSAKSVDLIKENSPEIGTPAHSKTRDVSRPEYAIGTRKRNGMSIRENRIARQREGTRRSSRHSGTQGNSG